MEFKILIDMNLSPEWKTFLQKNEIEAVHWSEVGNPGDKDSVILDYAKRNGYTLFTNDLDFSAILAANKSKIPTVIQIRTQDVLPSHIGNLLISSLIQHKTLIEAGAIITIDEAKQRARVLPLR